MNAAVCGVQFSAIRYNEGEEEDVVNDFGTVWGGLYLSRIGIQGAWGRKERMAYLKIKDGIFCHAP